MTFAEKAPKSRNMRNKLEESPLHYEGSAYIEKDREDGGAHQTKGIRIGSVSIDGTQESTQFCSQTSSVLIIDHFAIIGSRMREVLVRGGFDVEIVRDAGSAKTIINKLMPDLVLLAVRTGSDDSLALISEICARSDTDTVVLADRHSGVRYDRIAAYGAVDLILLPQPGEHILERLLRILRERTLLRQRDSTLRHLRDAHQQLRDAYLDTIDRLVIASGYRDDATGDHIARIGRYAALMALKLGLSPAEVRNLRYAAPMHDVGKIGIPDRILFKPSELTRGEYEIMKSHTEIGAGILSKSKSEILQLGRQIAVSHHEDWDGGGYPFGLSGKSIPLCGRIVRIVDVFDALTSSRPYKDAYPVDFAISIISKERGRSFDPTLTDLVVKNADALAQIRVDVAAERTSVSGSWEISQRDQDDYPDFRNTY